MRNAISFNTKYLKDFIGDNEFAAISPFINTARGMIANKNGLGHDFLGWVNLPAEYDRGEFSRIKAAAERIKNDSDALIVIGIGGSYLGARAVIELVKTPFYNSIKKDTPEIYFLGNNISSTYLTEVISMCEGKDISVNVISKSGTTTEPALAFRIFKEMLEKKYGKDGAKKRIYATTDKAKGTLKKLSDEEGYETFVIPDDIGGRYSVLTPVGLLPIAVAGINIDELMKGSAEAREIYGNPDFASNDVFRYSAVRNILLRKGYTTEITVAYEPAFWCFGEWIKQLYGESEGKDNKGLFPASMIFSTDLHSLGQYVQQGIRNLCETVIWVKKPKYDYIVKADPDNLDGLNFLSGKTMNEINENAFKGTVLAHVSGGVPNSVIELADFSENSVGQLIYFYEMTVAVSGYVLGVNPFDQPGVEAYKKNMFALLGKPGYEAEKAELEKRL